MKRLFGGVLFAVLISAPGAALAGAGEACVTAWQEDVQPVVNSRCVACHQNAAPAGELSLQRGSAPLNILAVTSNQSDLSYITPGSLEESYLYRKLEGTHVEAGGAGERMPLGGQLTDSDMAVFADWITGCQSG